MDISFLKPQSNKLKVKLKDPIFWAKFLSYSIPLCLLAYVLFINYLPFGYHKSYTINVGSADDTKVSEFYLEPSRDLSDRKTAPDGTPYRELNGMATAVFKPNVVLENSEITVEAVGEGVNLVSPFIDFDSNSVQWDKSWDFSKGLPIDLINVNNKAYFFDGAVFFDGTARLEFASSSDIFESKPFSAYAEWMPTDSQADSQQIIGHFNWELWQNKNSISFQIGRVNNANGQFYKINFPIGADFYNKKHSALAIYSPKTTNGYIELFIDGVSSGRTYLGQDKIWSEYGKKNISFGKSDHGVGKQFTGYLYKANLVSKNVTPDNVNIKAKIDSTNKMNIYITSNNNSILKQLKLNVTRK